MVLQMAGVTCQDNELDSMQAAQKFLLDRCKVHTLHSRLTAKHALQSSLLP